jgi:oligopeptide/dipeptide ABC transporter ATP-binding protein
MNSPLLEIRGLCKNFVTGGFFQKTVRVVDHVDLAVAPGEIRGLVGESGSGKTTLARCSLRLMEPSSGSVFFDGIDLATLSSAALRNKRREFQMVFQDPYASLNPAMFVEEIILEPLRIHRVGTQQEQHRRLRELMNAVSLDESLMRRKPSELSGGQQQRVGIARALALSPRLLVADEPVSALDVSVQAQILNLLSDLKRRYELTLILIAHSLYAVHYLCTHVSVMYRGRIVEDAPAPIFFREPKHPYSRLLLDSMPVLDQLRQSSTRIPKVDTGLRDDSRSGCPFFANCPLSFAQCGEDKPPLKEIAPGERVACFRY